MVQTRAYRSQWNMRIMKQVTIEAKVVKVRKPSVKGVKAKPRILVEEDI